MELQSKGTSDQGNRTGELVYRTKLAGWRWMGGVYGTLVRKMVGIFLDWRINETVVNCVVNHGI